MSRAQGTDAARIHQAATETLADLGEWELIRRLGAFAPAGQFSDDAALLNDRQGGQGTLVVNTDVLVEGVHFSDATTAAADVGWRAAAANLSDLAAMGATQVLGLTVGLVAPSGTPWRWVEGVYQGISQCLQVHGGVLLGGDCSSGSQRLLAITALGRLPGSGGGPIRRGDGRPGDLLVCTGPHGLSRLGLALLQGELPGSPTATENAAAIARSPQDGHLSSGQWISATDADKTVPATPGGADAAQAGPPARRAANDGSDRDAGVPERATHQQLGPAVIERAIRAHQRPVPRFDAVRALIDCQPTGLAWRVGGCDSSDGLTAAVVAIAQASGCGARLDRTGLPIEAAMVPLPRAQAWCLNGGEDFELVLALPRIWAEALLQTLPGSSVIGALLAGPPGELGWSHGEAWVGDGAQGGGYQHFH